MIYTLLKTSLIGLIILSVNFGLAQQGVQIKDLDNSLVLSNQYVEVTINKKRAYISSIKFRGMEMIGKQHTNWNIVATDDSEDSRLTNFPQKVSYTLRTDPTKNKGQRAELSFKFVYDKAIKSIPLDIDLRFTLGKDDKGIYLSALFRHAKEYPEFKLGQGRMIIELNPEIFNFYTVDAKRRQNMATGYDVEKGIMRNVKEAKLLTTGIRKGQVEHKYDYAAILAQTPTWGWTSTKKNIGFWIINPSFEYINGGPTQVGNTGHVEAILLNHWLDSHYGGHPLLFEQNEEWEKFVGPFYFYCNSASDNNTLWNDALQEAENQKKQWPYSWVQDQAYPHKQERGSLKGQIQVNDPSPFSNMWVGLSTTDINWQYEGKNYQFWVKADPKGNFSIANIRPGKYNLFAFADGIFGEFKKTDINITAGSNLNIGKQIWTPLRYGTQLWEIGIPDRSAAEFKHGDHYWQWGLYMKYPQEFPNDVNFTIGKSDWSKDWNYCQPGVIDEKYNVIKGTNWSINFEMPEQQNEKAVLRIGICGSRKGEIIKVSVNGQPIGTTGRLPEMGVMHRDGIRGKQLDIDLPFDGKLLKKGTNTIQLSFDAKKWPFGVLYDYLRLEIVE